MREYHVRICEGLGVKLPGPTRQSRRIKQVDDTSAKPPIASIRPAGAGPTRRASSNIDGIDLGPRGRLMREHGGEHHAPQYREWRPARSRGVGDHVKRAAEDACRWIPAARRRTLERRLATLRGVR